MACDQQWGKAGLRTDVTEATKPGSTAPSFTSSSDVGNTARAASTDAFLVSRTIFIFCTHVEQSALA